MQVAAAVCRKAAADGFHLKTAVSGRDLGVDCSAGSRRVLPIPQSGSSRPARSPSRSRSSGRLSRVSTKVVLQGSGGGPVLPTQAYGAAAGMSPSFIRQMRAEALGCTGNWRVGACTTAALCMAVGPYKILQSVNRSRRSCSGSWCFSFMMVLWLLFNLLGSVFTGSFAMPHGNGGWSLGLLLQCRWCYTPLGGLLTHRALGLTHEGPLGP